MKRRQFVQMGVAAGVAAGVMTDAAAAGADALLDAGVVTNRNSVPSDPNGAWYTSGVRLGTPALTTRGFGHDEFDTVGGLVMNAFGHLPKRNETTEIGPYRFRILNADSRRIHLIRLTPIAR